MLCEGSHVIKNNVEISKHKKKREKNFINCLLKNVALIEENHTIEENRLPKSHR